MVKFLNKLEMSPQGQVDWSLDADFQIDIDGRIVTVPKGFVTDLASTPKIVWSIGFPPFGYWTEAAAMHDFLYTAPHVAGIDRRAADRAFRQGCIACGTATWRAWIMWLAVRLFGASHWN